MLFDSRKKGYLIAIALSVALLSCFGALGTGAVSGAGRQATAGSQDKPVTITGCLAPGASSDLYEITDSGGAKYQLTSTKVPLKDHVNHKVSVTGNLVGAGTDQTGPGKLDVTELKMISTSCGESKPPEKDK
jgi:hypothetical protein